MPRLFALLICIALLPSCATVNPYVEAGSKNADNELQYALDIRSEVDKKRRELAEGGLLSGAALIPTAALVAYKGARGNHAVNAAALAGAGLAAYGVSQYLIQSSRLKVYTEASRQMTCAINEYRMTQARLVNAQQGTTAILQRIGEVEIAATLLQRQVSTFGNDADANALAVRVQDIVAWLDKLNASLGPLLKLTTTSGQGLVGAIDRICGELAEQLDGTIPTVASAGPSLDALTQFSPPKLPPPQPAAAKGGGGKVAPPARARATDDQTVKDRAAQLDALSGRVQKLEDDAMGVYFDALRVMATATVSTTDVPKYDACTMADQKATVAGVQIPLQLGPNNSSNNGSFNVPVSTPLQIYITGGTPKYTAGLNNPPTTGTAPKVELVSGGDATLSLRVTMFSDTPATKFVVTVTDGAGAQRQITVQKS